MTKIKISAVAAGLLALSFSLPAGATAEIGNYSFLRNTPAERFSDEDWMLFKASLKASLDEGKTGETKTWDNEKTDASGEVTLVKSQAGKDKNCRRVRVTNRVKDRKRTSEATFCLQDDGQWKLRLRKHRKKQ